MAEDQGRFANGLLTEPTNLDAALEVVVYFSSNVVELTTDELYTARINTRVQYYDTVLGDLLDIQDQTILNQGRLIKVLKDAIAYAEDRDDGPGRTIVQNLRRALSHAEAHLAWYENYEPHDVDPHRWHGVARRSRGYARTIARICVRCQRNFTRAREKSGEQSG